MTIISSHDVRGLLDSEVPGAVLVVVEGHTEVIEPRQLDMEQYRGALQVISRAELVRRVGGGPLSAHEVAEQASLLDVAVSELGG